MYTIQSPCFPFMFGMTCEINKLLMSRLHEVILSIMFYKFPKRKAPNLNWHMLFNWQDVVNNKGPTKGQVGQWVVFEFKDRSASADQHLLFSQLVFLLCAWRLKYIEHWFCFICCHPAYLINKAESTNNATFMWW